MSGKRGAKKNHRNQRLTTSHCPLATDSGFTLLEVLVAVAIVGISLVMLLRLHLLSLDATLAAQDLTTAVLLAEGKMATFMAQSPREGEDQGRQFDGPDLERFSWTTSVTDYDLDLGGQDRRTGGIHRHPARHRVGALARGQSRPHVQPGNV